MTTSPACCTAISALVNTDKVTLSQRSDGIWMLKSAPETFIRVRFCPLCGKPWESNFQQWTLSPTDADIVAAIPLDCSIKELIDRFGNPNCVNDDHLQESTQYRFENVLHTGVLCVTERVGEPLRFAIEPKG